MTLFLISLFWVLVCTQSVDAFTSKSSAHADFVLVFGKPRMEAHFPTASHFNVALLQTKEEEKKQQQESVMTKMEDDSHHSVLCVNYAAGRSARLLLDATLADSSSPGVAHTAYTSAREDRTCFLVAASAGQLDFLHRNPDDATYVRWAWTDMPPALKAHQSVMQAMQKPAGLTAEVASLENQKLLVAMGVGAAGGVASGAAVALVQRVSAKLPAEAEETAGMRAKKVAGLRALSPLLSRSGLDRTPEHNVWATAADYLEAGGECHWEALDVDASAWDITLKQLHLLASTETARMHCLAALVADFVRDGAVADVRMSPQEKLLNAEGKSVAQADSMYNYSASDAANFPYNAWGLDGTGIVVGVADSGLDDLHCFFINYDGTQTPRSPSSAPVSYPSRRKVVQYVDYADGTDVNTGNGHGTHVCGTVAGNDINYPNDVENGHAPAAKIAFFDAGLSGSGALKFPSSISTVFNAAYEAGAQLHSNSWGAPVNYYLSRDIEADAYMYDNPQFLAIFAAGNAGSGGYYSLGRPAIAKNLLTVGATMAYSEDTIGAMAAFSSIGPTFDGRIKPDVASVGDPVVSAKSSPAPAAPSCDLSTMQGTSMATPGTAGSAALVRQFYQNTTFWATRCNSTYPTCSAAGFKPSGATVKATLIHSGEAVTQYSFPSFSTNQPSTLLMSNSTPNVYGGFGRVLLSNVIQLPSSPNPVALDLFVDEVPIPQLMARTYTVIVSDETATHPLKATLVWMDPPNTVISTKLLLHDLDLTVSNTTQSYPGNRVVGGDDVNNVEQVIVPNAAPGVYTVTVTSKVFTESASQNVSVIITSGGSVLYDQTTMASVTQSAAYDSAGCSATGGVLVEVLMQDSVGDGWGQDNGYTLQDSLGGAVERLGSETSVAPQDFEQWDRFCLPAGASYSVELTLNGSNGSWVDVGLLVQQCGVYLSPYQTSGTLNFTADGTCNVCQGYPLGISLRGETGSSDTKGWFPLSRYELRNATSGDVVQIGTLTTGIAETRVLCVVGDGDYELGFAGTEFFTGSWNYVIEMDGSSCGSGGGMLFKPGSQATFTVTGQSCSNAQVESLYPSTDDDNKDSQPVVSATVAFVLIGVALLLVLLGAWGLVKCYYYTCGKGKGGAVKLGEHESSESHSVDADSVQMSVGEGAGKDKEPLKIQSKHKHQNLKPKEDQEDQEGGVEMQDAAAAGPSDSSAIDTVESPMIAIQAHASSTIRSPKAANSYSGIATSNNSTADV